MKSRHIPQRTCIGCGKKQSKSAMLRLVFQPPAELLIDEQYRLPGRGAYLCRSPHCLRQAINRKTLHRAFRTRVPETCYQMLKALLENKLAAEKSL